MLRWLPFRLDVWAVYMMQPCTEAECQQLTVIEHGKTSPQVTGVQNYPGRLHKAYLVGLPKALHWMMDTVKPVLHPQTVSNLKVCEVEDLEMPMRGYLQPAGPESPGTPSDAMGNGTVSPRPILHRVCLLRITHFILPWSCSALHSCLQAPHMHQGLSGRA